MKPARRSPSCCGAAGQAGQPALRRRPARDAVGEPEFGPAPTDDTPARAATDRLDNSVSRRSRPTRIRRLADSRPPAIRPARSLRRRAAQPVARSGARTPAGAGPATPGTRRARRASRFAPVLGHQRTPPTASTAAGRPPQRSATGQGGVGRSGAPSDKTTRARVRLVISKRTFPPCGAGAAPARGLKVPNRRGRARGRRSRRSPGTRTTGTTPAQSGSRFRPRSGSGSSPRRRGRGRYG